MQHLYGMDLTKFLTCARMMLFDAGGRLDPSNPNLSRHRILYGKVRGSSLSQPPFPPISSQEGKSCIPPGTQLYSSGGGEGLSSGIKGNAGMFRCNPNHKEGEMTIAQALRRVKKFKGRMAELTARAASVVSYEAARKPQFDFRKLRDEIAGVREGLVGLEAAVAKANATTTVKVGDDKEMTIAEAIRRLQELKAEMAWLSSLQLREGTENRPEFDWDEAAGRQVRRNREVLWQTELREPDRVAELDALRDRFERLNDAVEAANHKTPVDWTEPAPAAKVAA